MPPAFQAFRLEPDVFDLWERLDEVFFDRIMSFSAAASFVTSTRVRVQDTIRVRYQRAANKWHISYLIP
jgi:pyridoxine/pyridoxamine 5'-phosphate oxidase